ncbi:MAG: hypothetical protein GY749_10775 [Desulfobacteraceae bacterium]|nr:hypothetical protein [Desulfobacteraceae bacterium]
MNLSFEINCENLDNFVEHWSSRYNYSDEYKYDCNIGKPLTENSRLELFEWKNGSEISAKKLDSIKKNYPLDFKGNQEERYLNYKEGGGAIWNIFYLHCLTPAKWPIFDQHTFRAMNYIQTRKITEIGKTKKQKYESYKIRYIPFFQSIGNFENRKLDKALFVFGKFLKTAKRYV